MILLVQRDEEWGGMKPRSIGVHLKYTHSLEGVPGFN